MALSWPVIFGIVTGFWAAIALIGPFLVPKVRGFSSETFEFFDHMKSTFNSQSLCSHISLLNSYGLCLLLVTLVPMFPLTS